MGVMDFMREAGEKIGIGKSKKQQEIAAAAKKKADAELKAARKKKADATRAAASANRAKKQAAERERKVLERQAAAIAATWRFTSGALWSGWVGTRTARASRSRESAHMSSV